MPSYNARFGGGLRHSKPAKCFEFFAQEAGISAVILMELGNTTDLTRHPDLPAQSQDPE